MDISEIRTKYLEFFEKRGHIPIPSAPIIPENDPTTLFTGSGMQPLIPYLLGKKHAMGDRLVNSQTCFRAMDIDEVGDNRHTTFFEMLGNWSLGDYFKREQLPWLFEFLTKEIGIPKERLWVTCFEGDEKLNLPRDNESAEIWKELGIPQERIRFYGSKKNWWSRAGEPENMPEGEPGGPDSEVFYDFGTPHDAKFGAECHPNCECGRFLEIGNSVFMQYISAQGRSASGGKQTVFNLLPKQNVDFGGGLERIAAAKNDNPDIFRTDVFEETISLLEHYSDGKSYDDSRYTRSFRIIADHIRAAAFMIADGVRPSNTDRGYILRRLIRRASQHAIALGCAQGQEKENELVRCAIIVIEKYKGWYTKLDGEEVYETISREIWQEEKQFAHTLEQGTKEFEKMTTDNISGEQAFMLFTTYGFPIEMTLEMAEAKGKSVDENGFRALMEKHKDMSRAGSERKFKGGLADTSEATTRLHTAHHLLLKALQIVLGPQVKQRGSNITSERLRIDFSHGEKMRPEEIKEVERIVNEKIQEALPVICSAIPKSEAEKLGAQQEFGAKYPDMVSVYSVGPKGATKENPQFEKAFSIEFCGGPHVENTKELGSTFKILKEEAVASGIRRIKAVLM
ncbi:MAG: alanine--tRNA ligase [Candidatus Kaiserbacteria bacterium]|nr:alanine--tRNA ligase [Candidatus Kaiserbacteria bacterium]